MSAIQRIVPSATTLAATAFAAVVLGGPSKLRELTLVQRIALALALLNWRSWPFVWHIKLWGLVPKVHFKYRVTHGLMKTFSIGQNPFDRKVITKGYVGFDLGDWNMHMSNTSYGKVLDYARFKWLLDVCGPPLGEEGGWSPLGSTTFAFLKEIPMFTSFEVDVHVVAWDDKWIYYVARFTTAGKTPSSPRILNCLALNRSCFKLKGTRLTIPPARVLSLSGLGPDTSNWKRTERLRKEKLSRKWLIWGGMEVARRKAGGAVEGDKAEGYREGWEEDGLSSYEERRIRNLEIVSHFGNPEFEDWKAL